MEPRTNLVISHRLPTKVLKHKTKKDVNKNILYSYAGERSTNADTKGLEKARDTSNRMNLSEKGKKGENT